MVRGFLRAFKEGRGCYQANIFGLERILQVQHIFFLHFRCNDSNSVTCIKNILNEFEFQGQRFKGWLKTEFGDRNVFTGHLQGELWQETDISDAMFKIFQKNSIPTEFVSILQFKNLGRGVIVAFETLNKEANELILKIIKEYGGLNAGICKLKLEYTRVKGGSPILDNFDIPST